MRKKDKVLNKVQFKENGEVTASTRPYKIHVCAMGTMEEVIKDPFPNDPPLPQDLTEDELDSMVYGEVSWLVDNPGKSFLWTSLRLLNISFNIIIIICNKAGYCL